MGRLDQRLTELEGKQEAVQLKLSKLDTHMEAMGQFVDKKHLTRERKVILRALTDINIRIRNLQRSKKKEVNEQECKDTAMTVPVISVEVPPNDIDSNDADFDPEAIQFVHIRPERRVYPKIPLPHAKPNWGRVARVWRGRGEKGSWGSVVEGQFAEVEEDERRGWNMLDGHAGNNMTSRDEVKALFVQKLAGYAGNDTVTAVKKSPVSVVPVTPARAAANTVPNHPPSANLSLKCICHQPLHLLTCSSANCGHIFYGRLVTPCPHHPTNHYIVDHPTMCPICKAVPLVEDSSLTLTHSVPDQIFTKIKSKPLIERTVFTKSLKDEEPRSDLGTGRVKKLANDDLVLVSINPGKLLEKPPSTVPGLQKKCEEAADEDYKLGAAKSVNALVQGGGVGGDLLALRERLRRRLIVVKNARRGQDVVK